MSGLGHANAQVHLSPAFADQRATNEALHDSLIDTIYQMEEAAPVDLDHAGDVEREFGDLRAGLVVTLWMGRREVGPHGMTALTVPPDDEILREVRRLRQLADGLGVGNR